MKFASSVVSFQFGGLPMIGNLETGKIIALTNEGFNICAKLFRQDLSANQITKVDPALYETLNEGKFFLEDKMDNHCKSAYLHVTQRCNLQCIGCYSKNHERNSLADPPLYKLYHIIDELKKNHFSKLIISGGEPFLRNDLADLVRYAKLAAHFKEVIILTNGTTIQKKSLLDMQDYLDVIAVSFDKSSPLEISHIRTTQSYKKLIESIQIIHDCNITTHITATIHAKNWGNIQAYLALAEKLNSTIDFSLLTCRCSNKTKNLIPSSSILEKMGKELFKIKASEAHSKSRFSLSVKSSCGAASKTIGISPNGEVFPCHMFISHPDFSLGNIFSSSLEKCMNSTKAKEFRSDLTSGNQTCRTCEYHYLCGKGCAARSYFANQVITETDPYCVLMKSFFNSYEHSIKSRYERSC